MSASKARLAREADRLAAECDKLRGDTLFLLQALLDITAEHPEIELPELGGRFPEWVWRRVSF